MSVHISLATDGKLLSRSVPRRIGFRSHSFRPHPARAGGGRQQASLAGFLAVLPHRQDRRRAAAAERPGNARVAARLRGKPGRSRAVPDRSPPSNRPNRNRIGVRTKFLHYLALSGCDAAAGKRHGWPPPHTDLWSRHLADLRQQFLAKFLAAQAPSPQLIFTYPLGAPGMHLPVGLLTGFGQRIREFRLLNVTNRRQPCQTGIRPV